LSLKSEIDEFYSILDAAKPEKEPEKLKTKILAEVPAKFPDC
jgi:hypothetical protein